MYDYKRREKNKLNSNAMHRALPCTCSLKFSPFSFLFSLPSNKFYHASWPLLPSSSISLLLLIVVIFLFTCVCISHLICTSSLPPFVFSLFISWLCPPPVRAFPCLRKSVCWIDCCLILPHFSTHLVLVADCRVNFLQLLLPLFSLSLGSLACSLVSAAY